VSFMGIFFETIGEILAKLATWLRLKPSEEDRLKEMEEQLASARADNEDRLDELKKEAVRLENRLRQQHQQYKQARGATKRIIAREIELTVRELDRTSGREKILTSSLEKISIAQAKLQELMAARAEGVSEDVIDDIGLDLQEALEAVRTTDRAAINLERETYEPPQRTPVDVEQQVAELERGESEENVAQLSPEAQRRLKELEEEE